MAERALEVEVLGPDGAVLRPAGSGGMRRGARLAVVALAVVAVVGAAAFAVSRLAAGSGPQSPEAAVDALFDALAAGDVQGAVDVLRPAEQDSLGDPALAVVDELVRLGLLADDVDLTGVPGLSVAVDDREYAVDDVTDDLAVVTTTAGALTTTVDLDQLPLGDALDDLSLPDETVLEQSSPLGAVRLATVHEDGTWYVSLWHSVAENARREAGADRPADPVVEPVGADTPEAVVSDLVTAVEALDPGAVLALLDPEEAAPVYEYSGLFLPGATAAIAERGDEVELEVEVAELGLDVERDGSVARVAVDDPEQLSVDVTWVDPVDGPGSLSFDGTCVSIARGGAPPVELCPGSQADAGLLPVPGLPSALAGAGDVPPALVTVERDGRWYVSPGRTVVGAVLTSLEALEPSSIGDLLTGLDLLASIPLGVGAVADDGPLAGDGSATGDDGAAGQTAPDDEPALDSVSLDDPRVEDITAGLPDGVSGIRGNGSFDDAYVQRFDDGARLTVTRVFQLRAGFADIIVAEGADMPQLGEPVAAGDHDASIDRYGDGVVVTGTAGRFGVQVSVFGLDRGLDPETAALELYRATAGHLVDR